MYTATVARFNLRLQLLGAALLLMLLLVASATTAYAQAPQTVIVDDHIQVSCIGIDPPPTCGKTSLYKKISDYLTGGQPLSTAAKVSSVAVIPTAITLAGPALSSLAINLIQSVANLPNFFSGLWLNILVLLGVRKRRLPWGRTLNSVTQQPLPSTAVGLYVAMTDGSKKLVEQTVTDYQGRFGFLATAGDYTLYAQRAGYTFPTQLYKESYRGSMLHLAQDQTITVDLFGDPAELTVPWAAHFRRFCIKLTWLRLPLLALSTALAILSLVQHLVPINVILVLVYTLFWGGELANLSKSRNTIRLTDEKGKPLPFTIFRLYREQDKAVIATKVTNRDGEAYVLVPGGRYIMQVPSPRNPEGETQYLDLPQGVAPKQMTIQVQY